MVPARTGTWLLVGALAVAGTARAATVVALSERRVAASADAVVVGRVAEVATRGERPATFVALAVEEVVRGTDVPPTLWVRLPGGSDGAASRVVAGTPVARPGARVLVFLGRTPAGMLAPVGLALGWYELAADVARRAPAEGLVGLVGVRGGGARAVRWSRLRRRIPDAPAISVAGAAAMTAAAAAGARPAAPAPPARWFEPDAGAPVRFLVDARGDRSLGLLRTLDAVGAAMAAWNGVPAAGLQLEVAGLVSPQDRGTGSEIVFGDPDGEIPRPRGCTGILALGSYWSVPDDLRLVGDVAYARIATGEVTFADGWAGCPLWQRVNVAEVMAHELGHAVGLAHSADPEAVMFARAHVDGRGPRLAPSDADALRARYPAPASPPVVVAPAAAPDDALRVERAVIRYRGGRATLVLRARLAGAAPDAAWVELSRDGRVGEHAVVRPRRRGATLLARARLRALDAPPPRAVALVVQDGAAVRRAAAPCAIVGRARLVCAPHAVR